MPKYPPRRPKLQPPRAVQIIITGFTPQDVSYAASELRFGYGRRLTLSEPIPGAPQHEAVGTLFLPPHLGRAYAAHMTGPIPEMTPLARAHFTVVSWNVSHTSVGNVFASPISADALTNEIQQAINDAYERAARTVEAGIYASPAAAAIAIRGLVEPVDVDEEQP